MVYLRYLFNSLDNTSLDLQVPKSIWFSAYIQHFSNKDYLKNFLQNIRDCHVTMTKLFLEIQITHHEWMCVFVVILIKNT